MAKRSANEPGGGGGADGGGWQTGRVGWWVGFFSWGRLRAAQHAEFAKLSSDQSEEEAGHFRNFSSSD